MNAKCRSLGFTLREAGSRWKVCCKGMTCSSKGHRRTLGGSEIGGWGLGWRTGAVREGPQSRKSRRAGRKCRWVGKKEELIKGFD